jgi:1,4-alpha-glucan branching enzyme
MKSPGRAIPGATSQGDGHVTFAFFAPGKGSVSLVGDFNDWNRMANAMAVDQEGMWWITKELTPGSHTYQFCVDGDLLICDPYARALAEGAEQDPPRALLDPAPPYAWQHDDWARPRFEDLIIYELHIGDFSPEANFRGVIQRLDYLQDLGINAIELLPIFEFAGEGTWGYNPAYFFAVERSYGTADELRALVDSAHAHGIAVILDIVLAHTAQRHPFNKLYPIEDSPWYGKGLGKVNEFGFPKLDYTKAATQDFSRRVIEYWLREFHVDGYRLDYCVGIGCEDGMGVAHLSASARVIRPDAYLIGEYSPEEPEHVAPCGLDAAWHVIGRYRLIAILREGQLNEHDWTDFEGVARFADAAAEGYSRTTEMVNFLESHDEERVVKDVMDVGSTLRGALRKAGLGAAVILTMPGEPMLYQGQEWGERTRRVKNQRNMLQWHELETPEGQALHDYFRTMCRLRASTPALRAPYARVAARFDQEKVLVLHRWGDDGEMATVVYNFAPRQHTLKIPMAAPGRWRTALGGVEIEADDSVTVLLEAGSAAVLLPAHAGAAR